MLPRMTSTSSVRSLLVLLVALAGCDEIATRLGGGPLAVVVSDARGVSSGDQVRVHGVNVGRVSAVALVDEGARIELELTAPVVLHADACGSVRSEGLVGEAYVHVEPGEAEAPLEGSLPGCVEPSLESATAESLAELGGLITDLRRYVASLETGERALCTVAPTAPAPTPAPGDTTGPAPSPSGSPPAPTEAAADAAETP